MFFRLIITVLLLSAFTQVHARLVQAEGNAVITETGIGKARQLAIQDAMRQAALQAGARVEAATQISESALQSDSVSVRALGTVSDVVVLDEWQGNEDESYYVLIRADVKGYDPKHQQQLSQHFRRKVAVTQFRVSDRRHIRDLPNVEIDMGKDLVRRLQVNENFYAVDATEYLLPESSDPYTAFGETEGQLIVDLANRLGVQFIVTGTIRDLSVTKHPFWTQVRHAEIEIMVLDGISGTLVSRHRSNGSVWEGRLFDFPTTQPSMNDKFYAAPVGFEVNRILDQLTGQAAVDMRRLPFTARVIQARGKRVQFDVGASSLIKVGDVLMTYRQAKEPVMSAMGQQFLGYEETPAAALVVKQVQPQFAVGELESDGTKLRSGDVLRFTY
jgi:hypothetical protein